MTATDSATYTQSSEFSGQFGLSCQTLKLHRCDVTGGSVERAQRMDKPSGISRRKTVEPASAVEVMRVDPGGGL